MNTFNKVLASFLGQRPCVSRGDVIVCGVRRGSEGARRVLADFDTELCDFGCIRYGDL